MSEEDIVRAKYALFERVFDSFVLDRAARETLFRVELTAGTLDGRTGPSEAVLEIFTVGEEHVDYVVALRTSRGYGIAVPRVTVTQEKDLYTPTSYTIHRDHRCRRS